MQAIRANRPDLRPPHKPRQGLRLRAPARRGRRRPPDDGRTPRHQGAAAPMTATPSYDFGGQVAFVTGPSSGMGLATARAFAENGACVPLADIEQDALGDATGRQEAAGQRVLDVVCDVLDEAQLARSSRGARRAGRQRGSVARTRCRESHRRKTKSGTIRSASCNAVESASFACTRRSRVKRTIAVLTEDEPRSVGRD